MTRSALRNIERRLGVKQPVWDLPIRLFHWLLAALIAFSWWSVEYDHTSWHIWSGCAILTLLIFRLLWGFVGSSTARFSSFIRGPRAVVDYLRGKWTGTGHTPLGALSVVALLLAVSVQVGLGLFSEDEDGIFMGPLAKQVSSDTSDKVRDIHALWFYVVLGARRPPRPRDRLLPPVPRTEPDQADDHRPRRVRAGNPADEAWQMVAGTDLPRHRNRHHPLDHRGSAAFLTGGCRGRLFPKSSSRRRWPLSVRSARTPLARQARCRSKPPRARRFAT